MQRRGSDRQPESDSVWIDPRWKTISRASWANWLFGTDIVVEIKQATKKEWARKQATKKVIYYARLCDMMY
jgi:hypothetical protein